MNIHYYGNSRNYMYILNTIYQEKCKGVTRLKDCMWDCDGGGG